MDLEAARPLGRISIWQLLPGLYTERVEPWLLLAGQAMATIRAGGTPEPVPTVVVTQDMLPRWARGVVWDTSDKHNCVPVARSTRRTAHPGARQLDRAAFRDAAAELDHQDVDIVDQAGEGGLEARSSASLDMVLSFHHKGLFQHISEVDDIVLKELAEGWLAPALPHPPYVPCRVVPRNVIMQDKSRVRDGVLEHYQKPRVTTDLSDGAHESVNFGVPDFERFVSLPTVRQNALGAAIVDAMCRRRHDGSFRSREEGQGRAKQYAADAESAFRFCPIQVADLWTQVMLWDSNGQVGYHVDRRLVFGGAYAVNRFERVTILIAAYAQRRHMAFDDAQPLPSELAAAVEVRRVLGMAGVLPAGVAQSSASHISVYVDDWGGVASSDLVQAPPSIRLLHEDFRPRWRGLPSALVPRSLAHCAILVESMRHFGLQDSPPKTQHGPAVVSLGILSDVAGWRLLCPAGKREILLAVLADWRSESERHAELSVPAVATLTGKLVNLSQVEPALAQHLNIAYAICNASWKAQGRTIRPARLRLAPGGAREDAWRRALEAMRATLLLNEGIPLATCARFVARQAPGTLTSVTDASGEDGFGGYAFVAGDPNTVYLVSVEWPKHIRAALATAALPRGERVRGVPALSMPAAELFTASVVPLVVSEHVWFDAVYAVGDCQPAVGVVNSVGTWKHQSPDESARPDGEACLQVVARGPRPARAEPRP